MSLNAEGRLLFIKECGVCVAHKFPDNLTCLLSEHLGCQVCLHNLLMLLLAVIIKIDTRSRKYRDLFLFKV
jgi:membrane-bound metal-dependent hydrolase YbcI (DUF457 family)